MIQPKVKSNTIKTNRRNFKSIPMMKEDSLK